jgi:hypothetical protein
MNKESELLFFRWHCEGFLWEKRIGIVRQLADWVFVSFCQAKRK